MLLNRDHPRSNRPATKMIIEREWRLPAYTICHALPQPSTRSTRAIPADTVEQKGYFRALAAPLREEADGVTLQRRTRNGGLRSNWSVRIESGPRNRTAFHPFYLCVKDYVTCHPLQVPLRGRFRAIRCHSIGGSVEQD